jgi:hypothetical protein
MLKVASGDGKDHELQLAKLHSGYSLQQFALYANISSGVISPNAGASTSTCRPVATS